ncbi:DUF4134 domain-containing protein [Hymenobacter sp. HDW8]|uniref:DUF4134 domain-containing protein n=1 Tax=Hymenobacter sp. HDW8 TaxID=2714932 RepID=UPI00140741C1|nr:DUF4134 domain-containing protein [Hymenobacter sp. HDW8]QIL78333.1 DUF4134 domain-containing protein [Hymenobacter sp. HDW8]
MRKQPAYSVPVKRLFTAVLLLATATSSLAQGNGAAGIQEATAQVTSYFEPGTTLIYAIGAVVGLVGAVKVFSKWNSGDQDTQKVATSWFGSCIFLVVVATVLRAFFL